MTADDVALALGAAFSVEDHGEYGEITDADDALVALVGYDPLQIEVDLSVVLAVAEDAVQDAAESADRLLREAQLAPWIAEGFVPAELGAVYEGESADDPESGVLSYDLPVTSLARDADHLRALVALAVRLPRDFALWGPNGPLTVLERV